MADITICLIDPDTLAFAGEVATIDEAASIPAGWVAAEPPQLADGWLATWSEDGWVLSEAPTQPAPELTICRIDLGTGAFAGEVAQIPQAGPCPVGWVRAEPPSQPPEGMIVTWSDGAWNEAAAPQARLDEVRAAALDFVGNARWGATLFFQYDGATAWADSALGAVIGIVVGAQIMPPAGPQNFKLGPGVFRLWTVDQITAYGIAIRAHIQACFDRETALASEIMAADTVEAVAEIVASAQGGWPQ